MTTQICSLNSYYPNYSGDQGQEANWPVVHQLSERLDAGRNPSHPELIFSPLHGVMDLFRPSKRRATVDLVTGQCPITAGAGVSTKSAPGKAESFRPV